MLLKCSIGLELNGNNITTTKPQSFVQAGNAYWFGNIVADPKVYIYGTAAFEVANDIFNDSTPPSTTKKGQAGIIIKDIFFQRKAILKII